MVENTEENGARTGMLDLEPQFSTGVGSSELSMIGISVALVAFIRRAKSNPQKLQPLEGTFQISQLWIRNRA